MRRKLACILLAALMALNVDLRVLTQPGATGNQTISLAANFDPKAIILWASPLAAAGTGAHAQFGFGFGTYRGSVVQHRFVSVDARDAATAGNTCSEQGDDALLVILTAAAPGTRDLEIDLVSMQGGATSQVVINWTNLHTTASIKVNCLILGGSDITDALAGTLTLAASPQNVTVASGFGQPDLVFLITTNNATGIHSVEANLCVGFGKKGEAGRCFNYGSFDGNTTMGVVYTQRSDRIVRDTYLSALNTVGEDLLSALDTTVANWPTDGFRLIHDVNSDTGFVNYFLALKGTFTATTGSGVAPISGGLPVIQDLDHGSVPKLGFLFGWNRTAQSTEDHTSADCASFFMGAGDGTIECVAGLTDDDALGTSDCNKFWTDQKVVRNYNVSAALQSEADGSISGNNFRLSWNDIDSVAREYQWLTLGDALAQGISGAGNIASAEAFGTGKLVGVVASAGNIASAESLPSPRMVAKLAPTAIASAEALGAALLRATIFGAGAIPSAEAFGTPVIVRANVIEPAGIPTAQAFGPSRMVGILKPSAIASAEAFGSALLRALFPNVGAIPSGEALGSMRVVAVLLPSGIASAQGFGAPKFLATAKPTAIGSGEQFGTTFLSSPGAFIAPSGISSGEAFGGARLAVFLRPVGIASAEGFGSAKFTVFLKPVAIASGELFGLANVLTLLEGVQVILIEVAPLYRLTEVEPAYRLIELAPAYRLRETG